MSNDHDSTGRASNTELRRQSQVGIDFSAVCLSQDNAPLLPTGMSYLANPVCTWYTAESRSQGHGTPQLHKSATIKDIHYLTYAIKVKNKATSDFVDNQNEAPTCLP